MWCESRVSHVGLTFQPKQVFGGSEHDCHLNPISENNKCLPTLQGGVFMDITIKEKIGRCGDRESS